MNFVLTLSSLAQGALVLYSFLHIGAFLLSWVNPDPTNPIVSFVYRWTVPLWRWVEHKVPPHLAGFAPYFALMLILFGEIALPGYIRSLGALGLGVLGFNDAVLHLGIYSLIGGLTIVGHVVWFVFLLSVIWFVLTLVNPPVNNPLVRTVMILVDPFITPIQRFMPRMSIDLSPLILAGLTYFLNQWLTGLIFPLQTNLAL